jgi:GT2 family glycosyltransferase
MFIFYEDLDLCARAREHGHEVWFGSTTPLVHIGGASSRKLRAQALVHSDRGTDRFFTLHGPAWRRNLRRALTVPEVLVRAILWAMLGLLPHRRATARARLQSYRMILRLTLSGRPSDRG